MAPGKRNAVRIVAVLVVALSVAGLLGYHFYGDIKGALLSGLSGMITEMAGQRVVIGDVSVGPQASMSFYSIKTGNPEGFEAGELLTIDRVLLSLDVRELFSGRLHLPKVQIFSPELILSKDKGGRLNISDKLRRFLTAKSEVKYRIDELTIESGSVGFVNEATHQVNHVNLKLTNLSSELDTKTLVTGSAGYAQGSIGVDGWAYLRDDSMKFSVCVSVKDAVFPQLRELYEDLLAEAEQMVVAFDVQAEGDTVKSIALTAHGRMAGRGRPSFMKKNPNEIRLDGRASYNISDDKLTIHDVRLYTGQVIGGRLAGVITDVREAPLYDVNIKIERLDIAALTMPGEMSAGGIVSSDAIHVKGKLGKVVPHAKGAIVLSDASLRSKTVDLRQLNARVSFDAGREVTLFAEASSKITRVGEYALHEPSDLIVSIRAGGEAAAITVTASLALSAVRVNLEGNRDARVGRVHLETKGTLKKDIYTGEAVLKLGSLQYAGYGTVNAEAAFTVDYSPGETMLNGIVLDAEGLRSSARRIAIRGSDKGSAFAFQVKGLNVLDSLRKIEVGDSDVSLSVNVREKEGSGVFSAGTAAFHGFRFQGISGSGRISEDEFSIEIPTADIAGGRLRLTAQGKTSDGPFPVSADIAAEGVDLVHLSDALSPFVKIPYSVTGGIKRIAFRGTLESLDSVHGNASLEGRNITVFDNEKGRAIARDALFTMETVFKGRDLEFNAEGTSGPVSATASGLAREFTRKERVLTVRASLPETTIADIRTSLWDIFPDSLLYLGLEGSLSSDIDVSIKENKLSGQGELRLRDISIEGENGEYSVGPVNGIVPVLYGDSGEEGQQVSIPPHVRSELESIRGHYSGEFTGTGYRKVSFGSFRYGFPLLDDVTLWVKQQGTFFDIGRFNANMFGGRLYASGAVDVTGGPDYRLGIFLEGMSLKQLCDRIDPIRGYLSGNVDGIGTFRGSGAGLAQITGMADFWTYRTKDETTKISREFLQKLGGPSMKAYLGDRPFNKGSMSIFVKDGYVLFRELEISNRNVFGVQDLSVKVAPLNNRIAIDHLLWSLAEAGDRAKKE